MFVCVCLGITDSEIVEAINDGHDSVNAINRQLGAAGCCGSCAPSIDALIKRHSNEETELETLYYSAG